MLSAKGRALIARAIILVILLVLAATPGTASTIELIVNGGFETGDFTGWTITGADVYGVDYGITGQNPNSGSYSAWFGAVSGMTYLSQIVDTVPGQTYDASFWGANFNQGDNPQNQIQVYLNGTLMLDGANEPDIGWTLVEGTFVATSTATELEFAFNNVPGWWQIDDVSITAATPEPAALLCCGAGLALVFVLRRRRC